MAIYNFKRILFGSSWCQVEWYD